jgi:riboflavin biosynthesis pyrimidine reductase
MEEVVVVGKQTVRQAARLAASQVQAECRRERVERDRRLERVAVEVLTALGERDVMIGGTEQRAGAALQAMITDEHLTVFRGGAVVCRSNQPSRSGPASPISRLGIGQAGESLSIDRNRLVAGWSSGVRNGLSRHNLQPMR